MQPLHGTRILDLTRLLPGAVCTWLLHDLGAEVIKIEDTRRGDYARWMPPLQDGMGVYFQSSNRGKKSLALDLKSAEGQAILQRLVQSADALVEGFRPGVAARLGADYETLRQCNPRLVYCSLSGWGQTGPMAQSSGHDLNYIARTGMLGAELNAQTPASQVADIGGAYVAVMGILAALLQRERTGVGEYIDTAMSEAAMPFAMVAIVEAMTGRADSPFWSLRGESACYRVYRSRDGQALALAALEAKFWANFCRAVGKPDWIPQHAERQAQPALIDEVAALFASETAAHWQALLADADCCFTPVAAPGALLDDAQLQARGMLGRDEAGTPWLRSPIRLGAEQTDPGSAPGHGQHTREMLMELGYTADNIAALREDGVIRAQ